ncbi:cupin [Actinotalea sp.]|uniref:cupin n=1 Tax=Actinotalea sp. TaxID=1872145 RepID=UPI0035679397
MTDLSQAAREQLAAARSAENGRNAKLVVHDGVLRQSLIALAAGTELGEHSSPPAASIYVLEGRVQVTGFDQPVIAAGEITVLTHERHAVLALEDSVFLLTTVTGVPTAEA